MGMQKPYPFSHQSPLRFAALGEAISVEIDAVLPFDVRKPGDLTGENQRIENDWEMFRQPVRTIESWRHRANWFDNDQPINDAGIHHSILPCQTWI